MFEGFGPHIRRFGINSEVNERRVAIPSLPPEKGKLGQVQYPCSRYSRLVSLENKADKSWKILAALSKLDKVQELGLSFDDGLARRLGLRLGQHGACAF